MKDSIIVPASVNELVVRFGEAATRGAGSVFVGAGLSVPAGFPDWPLILRFAVRAMRTGSSVTDLSLLAQYYCQTVPGGREILDAEIYRRLNVDASPTENHRLLSELPITEFWTTNYDRLIEEAIPDASVLTEDADLATFQAVNRQRIYKMHGSLPGAAGAKPGKSNYVIARDDFDLYPQTHSRMWAQLQATYLTRTILFLGLSFSDPNISHLLRLSRYQVGVQQREHFTVMRRPTLGTSDAGRTLHDLRVADLERSGVTVTEIDDFDEIPGILTALNIRCRLARVFVSGSLDSDEHLQLIRLVGSLTSETALSFNTAGPAGRWFGYSFADGLVARGQYQSDRLRIYYQTTEVHPPVERQLGTSVYTGSTRGEMRDAALREVRAVLVVAGADGTADEVRRARDLRLPVIPLGSTGGTAKRVWDEMRADLGSHSYGGTAILTQEFDLLCSTDRNLAAQQAVTFLKRASFL